MSRRAFRSGIGLRALKGVDSRCVVALALGDGYLAVSISTSVDAAISRAWWGDVYARCLLAAAAMVELQHDRTDELKPLGLEFQPVYLKQFIEGAGLAQRLGAGVFGLRYDNRTAGQLAQRSRDR